MNGGAIDAIERLDPDAVLVKGDLTDRGTEEEYAAFLARTHGSASACTTCAAITTR